jgi:hypothetical protein
MIGREYIATFEGKRHWNVTQDGNARTGIIRGAAYIGVSHEEPDTARGAPASPAPAAT